MGIILVEMLEEFGVFHNFIRCVINAVPNRALRIIIIVRSSTSNILSLYLLIITCS